MIPNKNRLDRILKGELKDTAFNQHLILYHLFGQHLGEGHLEERVNNQVLIFEGDVSGQEKIEHSPIVTLQREISRYAKEKLFPDKYDIHFLEIDIMDGCYGMYDRGIIITQSRGVYTRGIIDWFIDTTGRGRDLYPQKQMEIPYTLGIQCFLEKIKLTSKGFQS